MIIIYIIIMINIVIYNIINIIRRAFRDYAGPASCSYDEHFRLPSPHDPSLDWQVPQWELGSQLVVPAKAAWGDRSDSGHLRARNRST